VIGGATLTNPALQNTGSAATDGNKAIGIPDYTVNANLEYDLPFLLGGTVTGRVIRTGIQQVDNANALQLPGWTRFDLGARYTFLVHEKPVTARFGVDNIADKRYWESAYGGYLLQGDGRTFKLSLSVDL
jgi:iron complex outermembrane receptor protein